MTASRGQAMSTRSGVGWRVLAYPAALPRWNLVAEMAGRGLGDLGKDQHLAERTSLMICAHKRDADKGTLRESWQRQAAELGFDARQLAAGAVQRWTGKEPGRERDRRLHPLLAKVGLQSG